MDRISVLIADDEPLARRGIRNLLTRFPEAEIIAEARHGAEAVQLIRSLHPDLIFLDVQMPELDGFQVLKELGSAADSSVVVFTTAFDTFAVQAFDASAIDYLVKPLSPGRFRKALEKVLERIRARQLIEISSRMAQLASPEGSDVVGAHAPSRRILVNLSGTDMVLLPQDIVWIEADDCYAAIHCKGRRYMLRESLASLSRRLAAETFVRVHRRAIVNLEHIREISSDALGQCVVVLNGDITIPLSRRRRSAVSEALDRFANGIRMREA